MLCDREYNLLGVGFVSIFACAYQYGYKNRAILYIVHSTIGIDLVHTHVHSTIGIGLEQCTLFVFLYSVLCMMGKVLQDWGMSMLVVGLAVMLW